MLEVPSTMDTGVDCHEVAYEFQDRLKPVPWAAKILLNAQFRKNHVFLRRRSRSVRLAVDDGLEPELAAEIGLDQVTISERRLVLKRTPKDRPIEIKKSHILLIEEHQVIDGSPVWWAEYDYDFLDASLKIIGGGTSTFDLPRLTEEDSCLHLAAIAKTLLPPVD